MVWGKTKPTMCKNRREERFTLQVKVCNSIKRKCFNLLLFRQSHLGDRGMGRGVRVKE